MSLEILMPKSLDCPSHAVSQLSLKPLDLRNVSEQTIV